MQGSPDHSPAAGRRKVSAPLDTDLRSALRAAMTSRAPEAVALDAEVSVSTVRRALAGHPVRPVVRAALARAIAPSNAPSAVAA